MSAAPADGILVPFLGNFASTDFPVLALQISRDFRYPKFGRFPGYPGPGYPGR
jgi:hypothetical protein